MLSFAIFLLVQFGRNSAFVPAVPVAIRQHPPSFSFSTSTRTKSTTATELYATRPNNNVNDDESRAACTTRRQAFMQVRQVASTATSASAAVIFLASACSAPRPVFAKDNNSKINKMLDADKEKLRAGYKRLNYLVDNWEKETTNCKTKTQYSSASSECERTPLNVQYYLGYRSTQDPLFRADKTMRRLEVLVPPGDEVEYLEAMEKFNEKAEEGTYNIQYQFSVVATLSYL